MAALSKRNTTLFELYRQMVLVRRAEARLGEAQRSGNVPGGVHLSIGQEAVAVGICSELRSGDYITSTHRGHGHYLAKGGGVAEMFAEIWGKSTGVCGGMGGSMHVADVSKGILGANGIVGGGLSIATGAALAAQLDRAGAVAVCFFGDGAANQGVFMESLNVGALWKLPLIFVCENNGVSEFSLTARFTAGAHADRARAVGIPVEIVDGNDVVAVAGAAHRAIARARGGDGPSYVEAVTYRLRGHAEGEETFLGGRTYRAKEETELWASAERDPISRFKAYLLNEGVCEEADLEAIDSVVREEVERAYQAAEAAPEPSTAFALDIASVDLY